MALLNASNWSKMGLAFSLCSKPKFIGSSHGLLKFLSDIANQDTTRNGHVELGLVTKEIHKNRREADLLGPTN
jgi:hypothetical protein